MRILSLAATFLLTLSVYLYWTESHVIDAVAAATTVSNKKPPNLTLVANPAIVSNTVHVTEGLPLTIKVSSTDKTSIWVGIYQNNNFYYSEAGLNLPTGAKFTVDANDASKATFTWTPQIGDSKTVQQKSIQFFAYNFSSRLSSAQVITIIVDANTAPVFDANVQTNWVVDAGSSLNIPLLLKKDAVTAAMLLTSENLPKGASLSKVAQNASGDWVASLVWTPKINQVGHFPVTVVAKHNVVNALQASLDLQIQVKDVLASSFITPLPASQQIVSVGKTLSFKLGFNLDPHSTTPAVTLAPALTGATLSKPVKTKNIWYTSFKWKPTSADTGKTYSETIQIKGNAVTAIAATFPVQITVN